MKAVVIGESSGATMETIMIVYPRHKAIVEKYIAKGEVLVSGPLATGETWESLKPVRQPNNL